MSTQPDLSALSLEEKARLLTGHGWGTHENDALGLRQVIMADGPHGLRKAVEGSLGLGGEVPATCFPPAVTVGSTWDPALAYLMGQAIGAESHFHDVDVLLGPGMNLKRSPLCGRNFEYLSEDPLLSGYLAAGFINGVQSNGVAACVKHYAVNNQETRRMNVDAVVDERTMHELYLRSFQIAIEIANPWTVMCSYNSVNGTYVSEDKYLLTEVLRERWGYDGLVMSDWGAVVDRARAVAAGLDVEMPQSKSGPQRIVDAVRSGEIAESVVNDSVARLVTLAERTKRSSDKAPIDYDAHNEIARQVGRAGVVLLKNEGNVLPLSDAAGQKIAVIGEFAAIPRFQGNGSSRVNNISSDDALSAMQARFTNSVLTHATGFRTFPTGDDDALRAEAVALAGQSDVVVLFMGLSDYEEGEGYDRTTIDIPASQIKLLREIAQVNAKVAVVLSNGSTVDIASWHDAAPAILEAWLGGQSSGLAITDILSGDVSPSGRLSESIPVRLTDLPAQLNFPGEFDSVLYGERHNVGYRFFASSGVPVAYPFGFGLSYTTFTYQNLSLSQRGDDVVVRLSVTNTGERDGHEVVQVYVGRDQSVVARPSIELKGFQRVAIAAKATVDVEIVIPVRHLAYWDVRIHDYVVEPGAYTFHAAASSADLRLSGQLELAGDVVEAEPTEMSTLEEWFAIPRYAAAVKELFGATEMGQAIFSQEGTPTFTMFLNIRLNQIVDFAGLTQTPAEIAAAIRAAAK